MYCRMCGKELPSGSKFCPACGAQQDAGAPQQVPPQTAPAPQSAPVYQAAPTPQSAPVYQAPAPQAAQAPQAAPKKKKSFIPILAVILVIVAAVVGYSIVNGQNEKEELQSSLTSYIEDDLEDLRKLEEQIVQETWKLLDDGDVESFKSSTTSLRGRLIANAANVFSGSSAMKDPELAKLHTSFYLDYSSKFLDAVKKAEASMTAYGKGDEGEAYDLLIEALGLMEEADDLYDDFQKELKNLADERDVRYKMIDPPFEYITTAFKNLDQ